MASGAIIPDETKDLPRGERTCHRCGGKAHTLWVNKFSTNIITLCLEHAYDHSPGLIRAEWFRVEFNDRVSEIGVPPRRAKLKR